MTDVCFQFVNHRIHHFHYLIDICIHLAYGGRVSHKNNNLTNGFHVGVRLFSN